MKGRIHEFADALDGDMRGDDGDFEGASIDTRTLTRGAVFFALHGEHADGHDFVARAASLGAAAVVVERWTDAPVPQIRVMDAESALRKAGALARDGFAGQVVGVTGSNGKTTVKQMLAAIFAAAGSALATHGNLNNHLGVPLTLMRLDDSVERAVIEMGASGAGEIATLSEMARPQVGVVTNAGAAHLEGFGSREGVARAKGEMFTHLPADGIAVINADDEFAPLWFNLAAPRKCLHFSLTEDRPAKIRALDIESDASGCRFMLVAPDGQARIEMRLIGEHNIANALAAAAAAIACGIDLVTIAAGLATMQAVAGRLTATPARHGVQLVDDSYNANPGSLAAALGWLAQQDGTRWAVLGDMAELGAFTDTAHSDAGTAARSTGIERLFATGEHSQRTVEAFGEGAQWFPDHARLIKALIAELAAAGTPVTVLVKGSRSAAMDKVADALRLPAADADGAAEDASC